MSGLLTGSAHDCLAQHTGLRPSFPLASELCHTPYIDAGSTMMDKVPIREQFLYQAGPHRSLPHSWLGHSTQLGHSSIGYPRTIWHTPSSQWDWRSCCSHDSICADFQQINQEWILLYHPEANILAMQPQLYQLKTPAKKFADLSQSSLGIGALTIVHWVATTSDGSKPQFMNPVAIVLRPLINSPLIGKDVGHDLSEQDHNLQVPAKLLGRLWPLHHIYPLIMLLFSCMHRLDADKSVHMWDTNWLSIYQFDHSLKVCRLIAIAGNPKNLQDTVLLTHPL